MNAKITSTAHYVPERIMTNFELEKLVDTSDEWIRTRTGISQRYIAAENEASSDLSTRVAEQLLKKRGISAEEIDIIIVATVTPDHFAPSTAALVQNNIGASKDKPLCIINLSTLLAKLGNFTLHSSPIKT